MPIPSEALNRARYIFNQMVSSRPELRKRLQEKNFAVDIIGKDQVVSDLPYYHSFKGQVTFDGRDFGRGTRGLSDANVSSVGEENLLCFPKQTYHLENILVHELAHSLMHLMTREDLLELDIAFDNAVEFKLYPLNQYIMANTKEYWALGTQAWFDAIVRTDVNNGINTRERLKAHDFMLARILEKFFGSTEIAKLPGCAY